MPYIKSFDNLESDMRRKVEVIESGSAASELEQTDCVVLGS